jgi:hypothetical protein
VKHLSCAPHLGKLHALQTNIRLSWKSLTGTNSSLLQKSINYGQKSFVTFGPGVKLAKLLCPSGKAGINKLERMTLAIST